MGFNSGFKGLKQTVNINSINILLPVSSDILLTTIKYDINLGMLSTLKIHSVSLTLLDGRFSFLVKQLLSNAYASHVLPIYWKTNVQGFVRKKFCPL